MARFLSAEWTSAVDEALAENDRVVAVAADLDITVQQIVTDVPGSGESRYWTRIADGRIETRLGESSGADVTIEEDYATAVAIYRGELAAQSALLEGRLKVKGNFGKLLQHQAVLQVITPILAGVPTDY